MAEKSLFVTYFLWLIGGFFGLHHFYLGRDFHALVWWMFCGGYFGLGLIRDLWRIPEYVRDANEDPSYIEELTNQMRKHPKPPVGTIRYLGQLIVSDALGYLIIAAVPQDYIPEEYFFYVSATLVPIAVGVGVYLVGNIGRHEGKLKDAIIGAYLTYPLYFIMDTPVNCTSFGSLTYFNTYSKQWRRTPKPRKSATRRVLFLSACGLLYLSLWGSWFYFNCNMTTAAGEQVKCREAARHFFTSPMWKEFVTVMKELWRVLREYGWSAVWREIISAFDPTGEANALQVLGLESNATQQDITNSYRKLSRMWHPDKHKDPEEKQMAQDKFIQIQQAYETLSNIKAQRLTQNSRSRKEESQGWQVFDMFND